jgi:ABC-type branched-subunit amino acid transport system substrate-binding protein
LAGPSTRKPGRRTSPVCLLVASRRSRTRPSSSLPIAFRLGLALLLLAVSAACAFPGTVRPTVKIGLVAPFEGRYRYVGYDVIYAVRLALLEANDAGAGGTPGVSGYGVELVAYDDGADPAMAVEQARKLDVAPDLVAALGHFREDTTAAALDAYARAAIPLVAPTPLDHQLAPGDAPVYVLGPPVAALAEALLDRASTLAAAGDLLLVADGGPLASALHRAARERGMPLPSTSAGVGGWHEDLLARGPSLILLALDPVPAGEVLAALHQAGWDGDALGGPALAASDFAAVAGSAAAGTLFVTPWPFPRDVAGGEAFAAAYRDASNGLEPGPYALPAYDATWMVLRALERAAEGGALDRASVGAALATVRRDGLLGPRSVEPRAETEWPLHWYRIGPDAIPHRLGAGDE